jgi:hypothetical protein
MAWALARVQAALGGCFTDSCWPATTANEHGNRADRADDKGRRADQSGEKKSRDGEALQQTLEHTRECRTVGDSRENVVQNDKESKTEH